MQATFHIKREQNGYFHIESYQKLGGGFFHFHSHIELLFVERGEAEVWVSEKRGILSQGELGVVLGYEPHHFRSVEDGEYTILFVPAFLCPEFGEAVRNKKAPSPFIRELGALARIREAIRILRTESLNAVERIGYIHVILGTVLKQIELEKADGPQDNGLAAKVLFYINEHYKEELSAARIAQALGYSENHLSKGFRAAFHIGIAHYINTVRLKNAVMLMREKRMSITDCALESGFSSLRTFYRVFEQEFGCAPKDYLKSN